MAAPQHERPIVPPGSQQLDWEVPRDYRARASVPPGEEIYSDKQRRGLKTTAAELLDKTLPPHRRYLGLRRRFFLCALVAAFILVVMVVGLGVGLTRHSGYVLRFALECDCSPVLQWRRPTASVKRADLHRRSHILLSSPRRLRYYLFR